VEDLTNALVITGAGLAQELFAYKLFRAVGLEKAYETVPYIDHAVFTVLMTAGAAMAGGKRWAQLAMYGGLSTLLRNVLIWKVMEPGRAGEFLQNSVREIGYRAAAPSPTVQDYVTYGDRQPTRGGGWGPVSDYVTFGQEGENSYASLPCPEDSFSVEPGQAELADYYGVTAF